MATTARKKDQTPLKKNKALHENVTSDNYNLAWKYCKRNAKTKKEWIVNSDGLFVCH